MIKDIKNEYTLQQLESIITSDGSHSFYVPALKENYHSVHGAFTESQHVFIKTGLEPMLMKNRLVVFETGFGTGLNALLTAVTAIKRKVKVSYYALEKFPLQANLAAVLNYPQFLEDIKEAAETLRTIHGCRWEIMEEINAFFSLCKIQDDMTVFQPDFNYDVVFYDAFAPEKQPEMWSESLFRRIYETLNEGGNITTYCVKGSVKRAWKATGFHIEKLPGPPGKREILRGWKREIKNPVHI